MFGFLIGQGASRLVAGLVSYVALPLALIGAVLLFGHVRYNAGKADEAAAWQAASDRLKAKAAGSAGAASSADAARAAEYAAKVQTEKERLDAAANSGDSPFDVLFPAKDR